MKYKDIIYRKVNLKFPKEEFIQEYDKYILPDSIPIMSGRGTWMRTREINKSWKMVSPEIYDQTDVMELSGKVTHRGYPNWDGTSLIELYDQDQDLIKKSQHGSVAVRNILIDQGKYRFKEKYLQLKIVNWIKSLPLTDFIGIRCVSLKPNTFASIHKDSNNVKGKMHESTIDKNQIWESGFVSLTVNLSNGGVPLFYSKEQDVTIPFFADDDCYLFNDFCWHGVPIVSSRRRQIRITARPLPEFEELLF